MFESDSEEEFMLTQVPVRDYNVIQHEDDGCDYLDLILGDAPVSLEGLSGEANFDIGYQLSQPSTSKRVIYEGVEIEDITTDEEIDRL